MKKIIIKLLNFIRRVLTVLKNHCLPLPAAPFLTPYEMYTNEQIKNCYDTFKPHFQQAIFLDHENYRKFIIKKAKIYNLFDYIIDGQDLEKKKLKGKPNPKIFLEALKSLNLKKDKTVIIEGYN